MAAAKHSTLSILGERPAWAPTSIAPVAGLRMIGRDFVFETPRAPWTLGTAAGHELTVDDPTVSSSHCLFEWRGAELWVIDGESKNGTFVNGSKIGEARLIDGSVLVVGRTTFVAFAESSRGRRSREEILDGRDAQFRIAVDTAIDAAIEGRTVVAVGEQGSGREALARAIHEVAVGPHLPFVRLALGGAGVEGAHALDAPVGTIFVHELGNLPVPVYGRIVELMRRGAPSLEHPAIPSGRLQIVVSASAPLWPSSVPDDTLQVALPPLRARGDDVLLLMDRFAREELGHAGARRAFGKEVLAALRAYQWPGNVAELREAVSRLAAIAKYRSVRAAAEALGVSKSALSDWLYRRGIPTPKG